MSTNHTILIADDEANIRRVLEALLQKKGYTVLTAENASKALEIAQRETIDLLISDLIMPDMNGVDLLKRVKALQPHCALLMITAYGTIRTAVEAMRMGAYSYITKPFDLDEIEATVKKALDDHGLVSEGGTARREVRRATTKATHIIGKAPKVVELMRLLDRVADSRATVLIRGESGTGKELVARAVHERSARARKPFIAVSCAALPETLLESELFGHERNAFTGAAAQKPGRFELADQGTLFLDEVADIPPPLQVKLLRVLQEREFERIGGTKTLKVDVRLVAATNRDLEKLVADGQFRDDLYYRLQVIQLVIPPLRERKEDIPALVNHFLARYNRENGRKLREVDPEAMALLMGYRYPGNIRELENAIERAVVMAEKDATVLTPDLLPLTILKYAEASETSESTVA